MSSVEVQECREKRSIRNNFLKSITDYRGDLFLFCRRLTSNPWDAEDLVQETLMKAYTRLSDTHFGIENLKSYLFKMATNQWIDWCRRSKVNVEIDSVPEVPIYMNPQFEVKDALSSLIYFLPPKERVAIVLKDVFDFKLEEIKDVMGTTTGAVKSALHRAREKMETLKGQVEEDLSPKVNQNHKRIVESAVDFFNSRDIDGFCDLLLSNATANAYGCFLESSAEEIRKGSVFYTINLPDGTPQPKNIRAECVELNGDPLFVIWDGGKIDDVWRMEVEESKIARFDCYYCCPKVLEEIANLLEVKASYHGYYYEETLVS